MLSLSYRGLWICYTNYNILESFLDNDYEVAPKKKNPFLTGIVIELLKRTSSLNHHKPV